MNQVCAGSKYALIRMEHNDELIQFYSNYPPVSWETEDVEKIEENRFYHVFGTYLGKTYSGTFAGCNVTRWWRTTSPVKAPFSDPYIWDNNGIWYLNNKDESRIYWQFSKVLMMVELWEILGDFLLSLFQIMNV